MQPQIYSQQPQPQYQPEYQPQVSAQQPAYIPPRQPIDIGGIFSKKIVALFIVIGLILMFVGAIVCNASKITDKDDIGDLDKQCGALATYKAGTIIYNVGMLLLIIILLGAALLGKEFTEYMRIGMFIAVGLILGFGGFNLWGQ